MGLSLCAPMQPIEVLLVEDNPGEVRLIGEAIAECAVPVRLSVAWDGREALDMLADPLRTTDLIILDLNLPKVSGLAFLARQPRKEVPIVIFSSPYNPDEIRKGLELGAREFVHKPMDFAAFSGALGAMLDKWTAEGCTAR
jgi:DNA-binding response OmpR family regulator